MRLKSSIPYPQPKLAMPKLRSLTIHRAQNGLTFTHNFQKAPQKQFVFENRKKALTHLRRTLANEWLHPNADREAQQVDNELNIEA